MAAIQPSLLTIETHSKRPPLTPERQRSPDSDDSDDKVKQEKSIRRDNQSETELPLNSGFLALFNSELTPIDTTKAVAESGEDLPVDGSILPQEPSDEAESVVNTDSQQTLNLDDAETTEEAPESELMKTAGVNDVDQAEINPTLAKAIQSEVKKQESGEPAMKTMDELKAKVTSVEHTSDDESEGKFFNPSDSKGQDSKTLESKPGGLSLLDMPKTQLGQVPLDDGLTALRNITPVPTGQTPAVGAVNPTATVDAAMMGLSSERPESMLLQLQGKAQDFAPKFTQQVAFIVGRGLQQAMIRLDPPELGRIEVKVQKEDERVQVQVVTQSPQARELVERNIHQLKELFAEQGMQLTDADVQQDQAGQQGEQTSENGQASTSNANDGESSEQVATSERVSQQLLDTYA
ncbi:flagellar hook-length control protein FliK [Salinibius halmophilus]|uniref:flagellar hook-length control protein FliK n=1 Tax=Salinibius halmophilus TaxID=1853216 RepID=UPI000E66930E|nr:flagellar hook-length control protein FliK [Salinibius halmophilus]